MNDRPPNRRCAGARSPSARSPGARSASGPFPSRLERFETVDSTQRIVREWLANGTPEVCVAVADVQTAGRGRQGRGWTAPPGAALLSSVGFAPRALVLGHAWRLGATSALAMLDAAEDVAGLPDGTLWLKWPNDIVAEGVGGRLLKLAGVLGEVVAGDDLVATAVVGLGMNVDWAASDFPAELAASITSLREVARGRPVDRDALLDAYLSRLEARYEALGEGRFDVAGWGLRQRTTGRQVEVDVGDAVLRGVATGVDPDSGALRIMTPAGDRAIDSGEVLRCRVVELPTLRGHDREPGL